MGHIKIINNLGTERRKITVKYPKDVILGESDLKFGELLSINLNPAQEEIDLEVKIKKV